MKAEHVTLIKKAIRMLDYMRADMVRILEAEGAPPPSLKSDLYAAFDAVTDAKNAKPEIDVDGKHAVDCPCWECVRVREFSLRHVKLSETEMRDVMTGKLNPFAPDTGITPLPQPALPEDVVKAQHALADRLNDLDVSPDPEPEKRVAPDGTWHDEIDADPSPFMETLPSSPVAEITEYERRKRELHAQRGSATYPYVCIARNAAPGVRCMCPRCAGKAA